MSDLSKPFLPFGSAGRLPLLGRAALLSFLLGSVLLTPAPVLAEAVSHRAGWGIGAMIGSPTGLTVKKWTGGSDAWDVGLGLGGFGFNPGFRLHADYLWGLAQVISNPRDVTLDFYVGLGPVAGFGYGNGRCRGFFQPRYYDSCGDGWAFVGARLPLGMDLRLQKAPLELALEIAPGAVMSANYVSGLFDASLIGRYLF